MIPKHFAFTGGSRDMTFKTEEFPSSGGDMSGMWNPKLKLLTAYKASNAPKYYISFTVKNIDAKCFLPFNMTTQCILINSPTSLH